MADISSVCYAVIMVILWNVWCLRRVIRSLIKFCITYTDIGFFSPFILAIIRLSHSQYSWSTQALSKQVRRYAVVFVVVYFVAIYGWAWYSWNKSLANTNDSMVFELIFKFQHTNIHLLWISHFKFGIFGQLACGSRKVGAPDGVICLCHTGLVNKDIIHVIIIYLYVLLAAITS